jgi:mRNA-degrading endonuclease RelE of RelBE toxin-antitoxin system
MKRSCTGTDVCVIENVVMKNHAPVHHIYSTQMRSQLEALERRALLLVSRAIERRLSYEPHIAVRNRKPLRTPIMDATWQLRFGPGNAYRVFYNIDAEKRVVFLQTLGIKERTRLFVDGKRIYLEPAA